jgi:hypothetical protein
MEHATQFPEEYSKMVGVQRKVRPQLLSQARRPGRRAARWQACQPARRGTHHFLGRRVLSSAPRWTR